MLMALEYLHDRSILHKDLRPTNIFLTAQGNIKLGSLKLSKVILLTVRSNKRIKAWAEFAQLSLHLITPFQNPRAPTSSLKRWIFGRWGALSSKSALWSWTTSLTAPKEISRESWQPFLKYIRHSSMICAWAASTQIQLWGQHQANY